MAKKSPDEQTVRVNLEVSQSFRDLLYGLAKSEGVSLKAIICRAVNKHVLDLHEQSIGSKIVYKRADGTEEAVRFL